MKERIAETDQGIQNAADVELFDAFARSMRNRGLMHTKSFLQAGITAGHVLEIGPGPGYVGLEWLKTCPDGTLTGLEISPAMIAAAQKNVAEYGFSGRINYVEGNGMQMPFADGTFDGVISNGSLHEWEDPVQVFREILRVLRTGGRFCVSDMRRDISPLARRFMLSMCRPKEMRPGFLTSLGAAYTAQEAREILSEAGAKNFTVSQTFADLSICGAKE